MSEPAPGARPWWLALAAVTLTVHAVHLFSTPGLVAGGDLPAHLRLMQLDTASLAIRNVYPPAYHVFGAVLGPVVGLAIVPKLFALLSVALLLGGFRTFQRSAGLPDAASEVFALLPYPLTASVCTPKVEFASLALMLFGLAALLRRRYGWLAVLLCASFYVHSAGTLTFGLVAGTLAVARRDLRGVAALAAGTLGAAPLVASHLGAGCSLPQSFLMSYSGYLPSNGYDALSDLRSAAPLSAPLLVGLAIAGGRALWQRYPAVAAPCAVLAVLYLQPVWMPLLTGSSGTGFYRGLSVLILPTAVGAGVFLADRQRLRVVAIGLSVGWLVMSARVFVPATCHTAPIDVAGVDGLVVERCEYAWRR